MYVRERSSGFTMIELLITIAILGIILAFAVPSFQTMIENNRVTSQANSLLSAVNHARTEAIKRGVVVSVQRDGAAGFANGYCVVAGALGNWNTCADARGANSLLREFEAPGAVTITDGGATGVSFDGRGFRASGGFSVQLEPPTCVAGENRLRQVEVSLAGRARLMQGACN
ncbi:GspH/FimT family pseudopilin [Marinobacter lacisalsi]|uniref:Type II secretion system protein H n=1 Tax=Marinobacter lacisalsi TaxID=475979 RepID=A0ABV8QM36_9GAMM